MNEKNQLARPFALPLPTIRRYPVYLRCINEMIAAGETHISSAVVAEKLGLDSVLARKDLAMAGVPGKPRRGYPARELQAAITAALGWDNSTDAVLVGVGSLGNALLGYRGFEEQSLSIAAAFDASPEIVGKTIHGVKGAALLLKDVNGFVANLRAQLSGCINGAQLFLRVVLQLLELVQLFL